MIIPSVLLLALIALNFKTLFDNSRCAARNTELSLQNDSIIAVNIYLTSELKKLKQPCSISGNLVNLAGYSKKN